MEKIRKSREAGGDRLPSSPRPINSCKPTPGPWVAVEWGGMISIDSEPGVDWPGWAGVAFLNPLGNHESGIPSRLDRANARLISAAPDLLEALRGFVAGLDAASAASPFQFLHTGWRYEWPDLAEAYDAAVAAIAKAEGRG